MNQQKDESTVFGTVSEVKSELLLQDFTVHCKGGESGLQAILRVVLERMTKELALLSHLPKQEGLKE